MLVQYLRCIHTFFSYLEFKRVIFFFDLCSGYELPYIILYSWILIPEKTCSICTSNLHYIIVCGTYVLELCKRTWYLILEELSVLKRFPQNCKVNVLNVVQIISAFSYFSFILRFGYGEKGFTKNMENKRGKNASEESNELF